MASDASAPTRWQLWDKWAKEHGLGPGRGSADDDGSDRYGFYYGVLHYKKIHYNEVDPAPPDFLGWLEKRFLLWKLEKL